MQTAAETTTFKSLPGVTLCHYPATVQYVPLSQFKLIRRNGAVVGFEPSKISAVESGSSTAVGAQPRPGSANWWQVRRAGVVSGLGR